MMQHETPDNYVLASGETHSVREFVELAFDEIGVNVEWHGERGSTNEYGVDASSGMTLIKVNPKYFRPIDIETLIGDPSKAQRELGWTSKTPFRQLVSLMVRDSVKNGAH